MDTEKTLLPIEEGLTKEQLTADPEKFAQFVVAILDSKKARDIKMLYVEKQTVIADYFVICSGTSRTQIRALADEIEYKFSLYGINADHTEGGDSGVWMLIDFGAVIVHIFNAEAREFYKLEKLYQDTTERDISELITND